MTTLAEHEARLRATEDFALLDDTAREQALADTRATINPSNPPGSSRESATRSIATSRRLIRNQLMLVSLLTPPALGTAGNTDAAPAPAPIQVIYTPVTSLRPQCKLTYIATQARPRIVARRVARRRSGGTGQGESNQPLKNRMLHIHNRFESSSLCDARTSSKNGD